MARRAAVAAAWIAVVLALSGCAERRQLVDVPADRQPAPVVRLGAGPVRCPQATVAYDDRDRESRAGAVPASFDGRNVLRCDVDYATLRVEGTTWRFTVRQWGAPVTPELRAALDLPDREFRPRGACAAGSAGTTAIYLVDDQRWAVRVLVPADDPCQQIRDEVAALLPSTASPADATFDARRRAS